MNKNRYYKLRCIFQKMNIRNIKLLNLKVGSFFIVNISQKPLDFSFEETSLI